MCLRGEWTAPSSPGGERQLSQFPFPGPHYAALLWLFFLLVLFQRHTHIHPSTHPLTSLTYLIPYMFCYVFCVAHVLCSVLSDIWASSHTGSEKKNSTSRLLWFQDWNGHSHACVASLVDDDSLSCLIYIVVHAKVGSHTVQQHTVIRSHLRKFLILVTAKDRK